MFLLLFYQFILFQMYFANNKRTNEYLKDSVTDYPDNETETTTEGNRAGDETQVA